MTIQRQVRRRGRILLIVSFGLACLPGIWWFPQDAALAVSLRDDFSSYPSGSDAFPRWEATGFAWEVKEGAFVSADSDRTFASPVDIPAGKRLTISATLTITGTSSKSWKTAGLVVFVDDRNYWHLALVEAPDKEGKKHFVELVQMLDGVWLSNFQGETALPSWGEQIDCEWEYDRVYRLRIDLSPEGIVGAVLDAASGRPVARRAFRFSEGKKAVSFGKPALDNGGFIATFDDFAADVEEVVPLPKPPSPPKFDLAPLCTFFRSKATGFFRVERRGDIWWVIDPNGYPFYVVGTDHANYHAHWCQKLGYAPYHRNMEAQFGSEEAWAVDTASRLKAWGFNTIAAGHSLSLRHRGLVHTEFITFGALFSETSNIVEKTTWTGFPNVFDPRWAKFCDRRARKFCQKEKDDPWLLGYFLDNELEWFGKTHSPFGLVIETQKKPAEHTAKQAWVEFLKTRHGSMQAVNIAWKSSWEKWESIAADVSPHAPPTREAEGDCREFVRLIAERYFEATTQAIRKYDPNHMILGCRFAGAAPDIWDVAGKFLDIVSVNYYGSVDLEQGTAEETRQQLSKYAAACKRPMMLTEWSHPALDSGLPCMHGAGQRFDTQEQRARAFTIYQKMLFALPFMVGSDFFMWVDEPAEGISDTFPEDTNYGLVNVDNVPYAELTQTAARLNPQACAFHNGETSEVAVDIDPAKRLAMVRNSGRRLADFEAVVTEDGKVRSLRLTIAGGAARAIPLLPGAAAGIHFISVNLDPQRTLMEANLADNKAAAFVSTLPRLRSTLSPVLAVANPTAHLLHDVVVSIPLSQLRAQGFPEHVSLTPLDKSNPPDQAVVNHSLALHLAELPPGAVKAYRLTSSSGAAVKAGPLANCHFDLSNGIIRLRKFEDDGDLVDEVSVEGIPLGRVQALMHQLVGQNLWVAANKLERVEIATLPWLSVLDITAVMLPASASEIKTAVNIQGVFEPRVIRPHGYKTQFRLTIPTRQPYFAIQCLKVENTDRQPWYLKSYFVYLPSAIGGSVEGDIVGGSKVPNYYRREVFWFDPSVGAAYGAVADLQTFRASFWRDAGGGQHPDVFREVEVELSPGEVWSNTDPPVYVYGVKGTEAEKPWRRVTDMLKDYLSVKWQVFP